MKFRLNGIDVPTSTYSPSYRTIIKRVTIERERAMACG